MPKSIPRRAVEPSCALQRIVLPRSSRRAPLALPARPLVIMLMSLVQFLAVLPVGILTSAHAVEPKAQIQPKLPRIAIDDLPIPVQEMRDAILIATRSGDIEDLRTAIEWNELPPEFGFDGGIEPIEQFRKMSKDGSGREILAILANLLAEAPTQLPIGPDHENNGVFVWPYLSEVPPKQLTPAQQVDLLRLMPMDEAKAVMSQEKWTWYRLAIAADGTWHIFSK